MKITVRLISFSLCVALLFAFVGCGNNNASTNTSEENGENSGTLLEFEDETGEGITSQQSSSKDDPNAVEITGSTTIATDGTDKVDLSGNDPFANIPKNLRGTTVTFAHFGDEGSSEYKKVIEAFTKKTSIKVKLVSYDQDNYVSTVSKQIAAKSAPDVIICNEIFPYGLEIAQPLQNLVDLNDSFWSKQITELTTVNGNTYFVNSYKSIWNNVDMIFYNPKIFNENKIPTPTQYYQQNKWTYETMRTCLEKIVLVNGMTGGYVDPEKMAAGIGSPIVSYDPKTQTFKQNLSGAAKAYVYQAENAKNKLWDPIRWFGQFSTGTIGLYLQTAYGCKYNGWFKETNTSMIDAVPMPTSYEGNPTKQSANLRCYGIARGASNPKGAAYFLRYFLDYSYYEPAGANAFLNESMKNVYFDDVMSRAEKEGINYYFDNAAMFQAGNISGLKELGEIDPAQVAGKMESYTNQFEASVSKMNQKLKALG